MRKDTGNVAGVGLPPGTKIGKYEIVERFAMGGQAIVYKAYDALLDRHVAIKQISSHLAEDIQFMDRFRREAKILAKLGAEQPCIVTIHDLIEDELGLFIVMEYVQGSSLAAVISETNAPAENKAALQVLWRLAGALHAVHAAGIIHRDIKPSNIIIGEGLWPTIMDFGVAANMSDQTSMVLGTTRYMAPELFDGGMVDGRADMYSLGFIMYELLAGKPKFDEIFADVVRDKRSATMRWMKWHGNATVQAPLLHKVNPGVPVALSHIVATMIAKDPNERFESMEALGKAIKGAFSSRSRGGPASVVPPPPSAVAAGFGSVQGAGSIEGVVDLDGDEPTFDSEPTVRLPKSSLSLRTRLILLGGVLAGVLALVITISVKRAQQREAFQAKVNKLFKPVADNYDDRNWKEVENAYANMKKVVSRDKEDGKAIGNTVQMAKAVVMVRLSEGHIAVAEKDSNWKAAAFKAAREAKKALERVEERFASSVANEKKFNNWLDETHRDLRDFDLKHLRVRSWEDRVKQVAEARSRMEYETALVLLDEQSLREDKVRLSAEQKKQVAALRRTIKLEAFMHDFRAITVKAEGLYKGGSGNLDKAKIEFERALAMIGSKRARDAEVPQDNRHSITKQLEAKIAAIEKIQKEEELLAAWKTALANKDPLEIKKAADDLIEFDPGHLRNEDLKRKVKEVMEAKARGELLKWVKVNGSTKQNEAALRLKDWLKDHPGEPSGSEVRKALAELERSMDLAARVGRAVSAYRSEKWSEAIPLLTDLLKYPPTETGLERQKTRDWIRECRLQVLLARAEALREKGQYRQAIEVYQEILGVDKNWKRQEIMRIVDQMTQAMSYQHALDRAKEAFKAKQYNDAIKWAKRALEYKRASVEALQIIVDSRYEVQMIQGRERIEQRDYRGAVAYFTVAYGIKKTDEVKQLIAEMKEKIKSGDKP